jgi:hypothetical protein
VLDLVEREPLGLACGRIVPVVVLKAEKGQILELVVCAIMVKVRHLALLDSGILIEPKTDAATPPRSREYLRQNVRRNPFPRAHGSSAVQRLNIG